MARYRHVRRKPETVSDLQRAGRSWAFVSVTNITEEVTEDGFKCTFFKVKALKEFDLNIETKSSLFVIFLRNLTSNRRIWEALHMSSNVMLINKVLRIDSAVSFYLFI